MSSVAELTGVLDGRWMRSLRTRAAIVDAWLELIAEGNGTPTAKEIAYRADVGLRTVFQHFSEMNALHAAAAQEFMARSTPTAPDIVPEMPLAERIDQICVHRALLFEHITLVRRASERQEWASAEVHDIIEQWERVGANDVGRMFAPELDAMEYDVCCVRGIGVAAVLSWSTWNQLRERRHLSIGQSRLVLIDALSALLS